MPERSSYEAGTPSWVDLTTSDVDAAKAFYGRLFGWEVMDVPGDAGGYGMFTKTGKLVAGVGPQQDPSQPVAWATYIAVEDADATAERAKDAGGEVMFGPIDVMEAGRMAVLAHPAAGFLGVWQARDHKGAQLVNEPGSLSWNELLTHDVAGAKAFGGAVFGWRATDQDFGGFTYTVINVGENGVGGMAQMPDDVPDGVPAHWMAYFAVEDCDGAVAALQQAGGSLTMGPQSVEGVGRFAVVADPQGATFGLIQNA
jgi:predicted enzyme related to lactoylglutathione lyase